MFVKKKKKRGFTLIELLVVIAIIGILATIVVVNVNSARSKAKDVAIKGSVDSLRAGAELDYDTWSSYASTCDSANYTRVNTTVVANGGAIQCNDSAIAYAAWAYLPGAANFYCVDSTGNAKTETASSTSLTACQ
ncbi:MAG: type II secretion system protein [Patescibacteria group bacterium]